MSTSQRIPVDENPQDHSGYDSDDGGESSRSLASASDFYRYENGRRYHSFRDGSYWAPNDQANSLHEKILHHLMLVTLEDKLYLAPISSPKHVIDLGTGTGRWAIDFADHHEDAEVLGVDLSIVEDTTHPNLRFIVDDICSEWTHNTTFDFVHSRMLYGSIADWPYLYRQCFESVPSSSQNLIADGLHRNMSSGGYIEQIELDIQPKSEDGSLPPDSVLFQWNEAARNWARGTGKTFFVANKVKQQMTEAGFVDVVENIYKLPLGPWSSDERFKTIGRFYREFWREGMEGWVMAIATRYLGVSLAFIRSSSVCKSADIDPVVDRAGQGLCAGNKKRDRKSKSTCVLRNVSAI
jgi:SAM-dependent methyltransferase